MDQLPSNAPLLSEAKEIYVSAKGSGRQIAFQHAAQRAINNLIVLAGDKPIDRYSRINVNQVRDQLFERGLSRSSIKRILGAIRAIVNFAVKEHGLPSIGAFSGIHLGEDDQQLETRRQPIPQSFIRSVQRECEQLNDQGRWLIALISDTGKRLSEAAGLHREDIYLNHEHPHLILQPHPWRRLKNFSSNRIVPLVGISKWAVSRAVQETTTGFLFSRYCNETKCKSNSASAALNKWLSPRVPSGCVIHSLRHSFRDRLRAVECPQDIIDRLGGWTVDGVGEGYGTGYPIEILTKWMRKGMC